MTWVNYNFIKITPNIYVLRKNYMDPTMKTAMTTAILMISFLTMYHNALRDYVTLRSRILSYLAHAHFQSATFKRIGSGPRLKLT